MRALSETVGGGGDGGGVTAGREGERAGVGRERKGHRE